LKLSEVRQKRREKMSAYILPSPEMRDESICHHCHSRPPAAGLTLSGIPACLPCFEQSVAAENARKGTDAPAKRATGFVPKVTEAPAGPGGGIAIVGFNPPKH
jgi:hypothetical protein